MMSIPRSLLLIISIVFLFESCTVFNQQSKTHLGDGYYTYSSEKGKRKIYLETSNDTICIHSLKDEDGKRLIDPTKSCELFGSELKTNQEIKLLFSKNSFDIDFLTIPLKFRPSQTNVPPQLNSNLNGAVYFGFRKDNFTVKYPESPLKHSDRQINHFAYSFGLFTGIGNTFISPTTTNSKLNQEYDGIVWSKGIAGIVAINNFTVGLTFGFDNLLDKNHKIWVYESKPWLGLGFGLNLN